jgi:hypothetical protein
MCRVSRLVLETCLAMMDSYLPAEQPPQSVTLNEKSANLALGIEKIGFWSLRAPIVAVLVAIAVLVAAGFGIARIKVDDSLSQLFRSNTPEFRQFEQVAREFPSNEYDRWWWWKAKACSHATESTSFARWLLIFSS